MKHIGCTKREMDQKSLRLSKIFKIIYFYQTEMCFFQTKYHLINIINITLLKYYLDLIKAFSKTVVNVGSITKYTEQIKRSINK